MQITRKMSSKRNVTAPLAAAPLAIIDGTHLALLPSLDLSAMMARGECIVPSVPLKDVPLLIGRRYISFFHDEVKTTIDGADEIIDEDVFERLQVDASDLVDDIYFIHPTKLSVDHKSALPTVRIWPEQSMNAVSMSWSDDNTLDVRMPVIDDSNEIRDIQPCDDRHIYGDSNSLLYDYEAASRARDTKQFMDIQNAGSCLVADFLGMGAYEQALLLPRLDGGPNIIFEQDNGSDKDVYLRYRSFMKAILSRSFLTDGHGVLHSEQIENLDFEIRDDNSVAMTLPSMSLGDISADFSKSEICKPKVESMPSSVDKSMDVQTDNTPQESDKTNKDPPWLKALEKTIEHRISKKQNEAAQIEKSNQVCQHLIARGRETLDKAIRRGLNISGKSFYSESLQDPQVVKLRYGMQPRSSMDANSISVVMDLEIDVYLPKILHSDKLSEMESVVIHEFHVSCLVPKNDHSSSRGSSNDAKVSCQQIRTVSGLVPTLKPGDCVTVMAGVYFDNLSMSSLTDLTNSSEVDLSIQGCWVDGVARVQGEQADNRHGTVLCVLRLSEEMLYLSPWNISSSNSGRCIHHEIKFEVHAPDQELVASAIYEYREPNILAFDTSGLSNLQDPMMWKDFITSLNRRIGFNSHIDLFWKNGDPKLKLVIFGTNKEEQAATVKLVIQHLPDSLKGVPHTDSF